MADAPTDRCFQRHPFSRLRRETYRSRCPTLACDASRPSGDTGRDIAEAEQMLDRRRHRIFKLKIGANPLEQDLKHVLAIKKALGDRASVRVDVNQYWDESQAIRGWRRFST